jgi:transposase
MSQTCASPAPAQPEFAAFIAIDWADRKHDWMLFCPATGQTQRGELINTPETISAWATQLAQRFPSRPLAVILEQKRGPLICQLTQFAHLTLFPAHPSTLARFRHAFFPSGAKSDPGDTGLLLKILLEHRDLIRPLQPDTPATRLLQMLVETRRKTVDEKTRLANRLTAGLKTYYPQALDWIDDIDSPLGLDWLERWPSLQSVQRAKPNTIAQFLRQHHSRSESRIQDRINAIYDATPATGDPAMVEAGELATAALVGQLRALSASIAQLEQRILQVEEGHPDAPLFAHLPGAGDALRPRLIAAFGTLRERFANAGELQSYSGIAPVRKQSGKTQSVHFRRCCPKFVRQTFHEFAQHSVGQSAWATAYYEHQREKGKHSHNAAVRALAFKWIRVLFACWRDRTPYDEAIYLRALERHHSPLSRVLKPATQAGWKPVAGFQKFSAETS